MPLTTHTDGVEAVATADGAAAGTTPTGTAAGAAKPPPHAVNPALPARAGGTVDIDPGRLLHTLETLAGIGYCPGQGINRVAFSEADALGREYVAGLMLAAGLQVDVDAAGNLRGVLGTPSRRRPAIAIGSHLDTVPNGGAYDGAYGVLAGVEVATTLHAHGIDQPLVVVAFANEEGAYGVPMWGSRAAVGRLARQDVEHVLRQHADLPVALRRATGDVLRAHDCAWNWDLVCGFVELHIEQGSELARSGVPIAAVTAIVSRVTLDVEVLGVTNHAGTTPMAARHDALVAAAEAVLLVRSMAAAQARVRTATVGEFTVDGGAVNVIPGRVSFTVDLRDHDQDALRDAERSLRAQLHDLGERHGVQVDVRRRATVQGALLDRRVQDVTTAACARLGVACTRMPSGAGHDAQIVAASTPTGMIFVPSVGGVSHAPGETTDPQDLVLGVRVLLETVLALAPVLTPPALG